MTRLLLGGQFGHLFGRWAESWNNFTSGSRLLAGVGGAIVGITLLAKAFENQRRW